MRDERGPWYLLTGLILGAALGLVYAWLVAPREYSDTSPASLKAGFKDQYRVQIASAYLANGNLARASARLDLLKDEDSVQALAEQAQRALAEGASPRDVQALGVLAVAMGQDTPPAIPPLTPAASQSPPASPSLSPDSSLTPSGTEALPASAESTLTPPAGSETSGTAVAAGTDGIATAVRTLGAIGTPLPTRTPTPTPKAPFVLKDQTLSCDRNPGGPLLMVLAEDSAGRPLPGVEAILTWDAGEDHFFTGLKPELGLGYADFLMEPGTVYSLRLADGGQPVSDLTAAECEAAGGKRYWGSWLLVFAQP